jgi:hypothetical protein
VYEYAEETDDLTKVTLSPEERSGRTDLVSPASFGAGKSMTDADSPTPRVSET